MSPVSCTNCFALLRAERGAFFDVKDLRIVSWIAVVCMAGFAPVASVRGQMIAYDGFEGYAAGA